MSKLELSGPWRFRLIRKVDETGVSGTGHVADGVQFEDGTCVLRWRTRVTSTSVYKSLAELIEIHGHNGATVAVFEDEPPTPAFRQGASHCAQDGFENAPFGSIGGLDARANPVPRFAKPGEEAEYLRGYIACARAAYGEDWATCEFSWAPALTIEGRG